MFLNHSEFALSAPQRFDGITYLGRVRYMYENVSHITDS